MSSRILMSFLILLLSFGFFRDLKAKSNSRSDLQPIIIEQRNQQLCEGPLHTNCPRDGKLFGDLSWSPFSNDQDAPPPPPESTDVIPADVEGIEYNDDVPHPLET